MNDNIANLAAEEEVSTSIGVASELTHLEDLRPHCRVPCGSIDTDLWRICMLALFNGTDGHLLSLVALG